MAKNPRQVTFRLNADLWKKFGMKCLEQDKSKTAVLIEFIKKFCK